MSAVAAIEANPTLKLIAPLSGYLVAIDQVPDPVFAEKMVGDGIAIDPTTAILLAPCEGDVLQLHPAHHAVTIRTPEGIEVLMHIGLDTVALRGQGFQPQVQEGDRVHVGQPLIQFEADYVATQARSLLTQMVITNGERVTHYAPQQGRVQAGQDVILALTLAETTAAAIATSGPAVVSDIIVIPNPTGLHARPAAVLANLAKKYQAVIKLRKGNQTVNARSVVALMGLQVERGDKVQLVAEGEDATAAIAELSRELRSGLGEVGFPPAAAPASVAVAVDAAPPPRPQSTDPNLIVGVAAAPGIVVGQTYRLRPPEITVVEAGREINQERRHLNHAIEQAQLELEALRAKVHGQADAGKAAIFAAHMELLEDPELLDLADRLMAQGKSAAFAWQQAFTSQAQQLAQLKNELLAARANDLRDVGGRVLRVLTGAVLTPIQYPDQAILLAEDLNPSDTATLDRSRVLGFATVAGGATSHVAILARALDLAAIAGADPRILDLPDGTPVILDGTQGVMRLNATPAEMEQVKQRQARLAVKRQADLQAAFAPATTTDGHGIEVVANIGNQAEAEKLLQVGGEGVGLLRSEFVFMDRPTAPTEDEQAELYGNIARLLQGKPLIIRTLDVGGDKPLPYLPLPHEANPFLGERGVRIGFDRPEILRTQLRAILRASQQGQVKVMFPMIARLEEWRLVKAMLEEERQRLGVAPIAAGIMVEVPATAILAEQFAQVVDFFSVGTNDLTQYTLAMDRGHPKLAPFVDALHPSVLALIGMAASAANQHGKWCGVCGGIASDPQAVPLLIGLGVKELSVSVPTIPSIKARVREFSLADCQQLAMRALQQGTAEEVRALCPSDEV